MIIQFTSISTSAVLFLSGVSAVSQFNNSLRNVLIDSENDENFPKLGASDKLPGHLAYLAEQQRKVEIDSEEKMRVLMKTIEMQKKFLESRKSILENEIQAIEAKRNSISKFLNHKDLKRSCDLKRARIAKDLSDIEDFNKFLEYCPNGQCYELVANSSRNAV